VTPALNASVANDLGCVKTQKFEKRRELFFSGQAKANTLTNFRAYYCDSEQRSFYRRGAALCFYTAKTLSGHVPLRIAAQNDRRTPFRRAQIPALIET
jgi:hypothetical protein